MFAVQRHMPVVVLHAPVPGHCAALEHLQRKSVVSQLVPLRQSLLFVQRHRPVVVLQMPDEH